MTQAQGANPTVQVPLRLGPGLIPGVPQEPTTFRVAGAVGRPGKGIVQPRQRDGASPEPFVDRGAAQDRDEIQHRNRRTGQPHPVGLQDQVLRQHVA